MKTIEDKLNKLPSNLQKEALDFIEFLTKKNNKRTINNQEHAFTFSWEGGLSNIRNNYTSVELQHKSTD